MAAEYKVKQYLAYWLQAGKQLICPAFPDGYPLPSILQSDRYSPEFQQCWEYASGPASAFCYITGIDQTIQDLLEEEWEIVSCARCDMPIPMVVKGLNAAACPCSDLELWPNFELPRPRSPVNTHDHLRAIHARLLAVSIAVAQTKDVAQQKDIDQQQEATGQDASREVGPQATASHLDLHGEQALSLPRCPHGLDHDRHDALGNRAQ